MASIGVPIIIKKHLYNYILAYLCVWLVGDRHWSKKWRRDSCGASSCTRSARSWLPASIMPAMRFSFTSTVFRINGSGFLTLSPSAVHGLRTHKSPIRSVLHQFLLTLPMTDVWMDRVVCDDVVVGRSPLFDSVNQCQLDTEVNVQVRQGKGVISLLMTLSNMIQPLCQWQYQALAIV